ncbi:hypothetical protein PPACK8108_LOCUS16643 [Phakopsora pachyrhizi]|uniref:Uncharacterized protein n=1 Tax=Phakopsora pachyrhizi TaxID=170000 RepID=A0AAV0BBC9_PHAPC|nr:hypothetical protein PPACK8108_LOCUS16643 [Phakopsora pachyrhizi]
MRRASSIFEKQAADLAELAITNHSSSVKFERREEELNSSEDLLRETKQQRMRERRKRAIISEDKLIRRNKLKKRGYEVTYESSRLKIRP